MDRHSGHVMTLANSIIGVGVLAMPYCFQKCGIVLAILLLFLSNWNTQICCHYLIKSSLLTRRRSFEFLGFHAFGGSGKLFVEVCIIGYLLGTCVTYFVVVGDLGPQILSEILDIEDKQNKLRIWIMVIVSVMCVIPLGLLKNVDSLSAICTASIVFYMCFILKIALESGSKIVDNSWIDKVVYWEPGGVLQCLPIFSMALSCQMQIFEIFESINNQSLDKLNGIVRNSTWICTFVYIAVGLFGYIAYCQEEFSGNVLTNLSSSFGSNVIKIGFIISVAFSFPLVIFPCRASIYSLLYRKGTSESSSSYIPETRFRTITVCIVGISLCVALMIPSIELVIGLVGSTIGVAICIMFPALSFRRIVKKESTERSSAQFIFICGFCLMILSTFANLNAIDERNSGVHPITLHVDDTIMMPPIPKQIQNDVAVAPVTGKIGESEKNSAIKNKMMLTKKEPLPPLPFEEKQLKILDDLSVKSSTASNDPQGLKKDSKPLKAKVSVPSKPSIVTEIHLNKAPSLKKLKDVKETESIDKAAIIKDEDVNAEELKDNNVVVELKKTNIELRETKDMLERRVGALEKELIKQNKETQQLVEEKLEKVADRVEKIERHVQENEVTNEKLKNVNLVTSSVLLKSPSSMVSLAEKIKTVNDTLLKKNQMLPLPIALKLGLMTTHLPEAGSAHLKTSN